MFNSLIAICWIIFTCVWLVLSAKSKRTIGEDKRPNPWIRLIITTVAVILFFNIGVFKHFVSYQIFPYNPLAKGIGVLICAGGIALAIWARRHLGRNWGMPMTLKEKPELVTTGPYHFIRHPIYTGISVAMLGSMITAGFMWLVWFVLFCSYFLYSARKEEKLMLIEFPKEYPEYMKRTKMLIPFVF
jgi:protein-S-isoprenylcysteine O-methyltransferase Ste14